MVMKRPIPANSFCSKYRKLMLKTDVSDQPYQYNKLPYSVIKFDYQNLSEQLIIKLFQQLSPSSFYSFDSIGNIKYFKNQEDKDRFDNYEVPKLTPARSILNIDTHNELIIDNFEENSYLDNVTYSPPAITPHDESEDNFLSKPTYAPNADNLNIPSLSNFGYSVPKFEYPSYNDPSPSLSSNNSDELKTDTQLSTISEECFNNRIVIAKTDNTIELNEDLDDKTIEKFKNMINFDFKIERHFRKLILPKHLTYNEMSFKISELHPNYKKDPRIFNVVS